MPWRETCPMDQRRKFIADLLHETWSMSALCQAYGISRKTGYKWLERFEAEGMAGLSDQSRARRTHPNVTAAAIEGQIVELRHSRPFWGPRKLKKRLERIKPDLGWPASSTIGAILKRHGLSVARKASRRTPIYPGPFVGGSVPNDVWAADFKGWFRTGDGTRIDPLTVTDCASRYLIHCRAVARTDSASVQGQLTTVFREYGMPKALKTDNGVPFATVGLGGLSELSVWLIRLGIMPERIRPAHPEENGAHERMHRTLKQQTANPPKANPRAQQKAFDAFQAEFNNERPHEALGMITPEQAYGPSARIFPQRLPEIQYPSGLITRRVAENGTISFQFKRIYVSNALIFEPVRLEETNTGWEVWYGPVHLGQLDLKREIIKRPKKVLPMCPV